MATTVSSSSSSSTSTSTTTFEVYVAKDDFKFHAAHFVAFEGFRERLHGHNYKCGVRLFGSHRIASDGYVVDFGNIKKAVRLVCKQLNEHFLCPTLSDVMTIEEDVTTSSVTLTCQDGAVFRFPRDDCAMLPIVHATAEELAIYLWSRILQGLDAQYLLGRGVHNMEVIVAEAVGQEATFRLEIPSQPELQQSSLDVASFIQNGQIRPTPCPGAPTPPATSTPPTPSTATATVTTATSSNSAPESCCDGCLQSLSLKLERLAKAINEQQQQQQPPHRDTPLTASDIQRMMDDM